MKKLLALLSIPLIAITTACAPKAPVATDYFTGVAPIGIWSHRSALVKDFDNDGLADAIMDENNTAIFYAKGYEKQAHVTSNSIEMTPALRLYASDFIKADNGLRFEAEKADYNKIKSKYDTTEVKE